MPLLEFAPDMLPNSLVRFSRFMRFSSTNKFAGHNQKRKVGEDVTTHISVLCRSTIFDIAECISVGFRKLGKFGLTLGAVEAELAKCETY